jgi:phage terminase large subunit-like protein
MTTQQGVQYPRILSYPPNSVSSAGDEAIDLAATAGLVLDEWQKVCLRHMLAEKVDGRWAAFECGLVCSRQNGKGVVLAARELFGLYLGGERLQIHSAHLFETSLNHFQYLLGLIEGCPDLNRRVKSAGGVSNSHGKEGITLTSGASIRFRTRTKGGGRGLSADLVVIDEAQELPDAALAALLPTLSARSNPQVIYAGSAVDQEVHDHGVALARLRERSLAGDDPSLFWAEWSAPGDLGKITDAELDDHGNWAQANPALGLRVSADHMADERRSLSARSFATERLSIGDWPSTAVGTPPVVDPGRWAACADASSTIEGHKAFAFDVSQDRTTASIAVAGKRTDGLMAVAVLDCGKETGWIVDRLAQLVADHGGEVYVDERGPAAALISELERREIPHGELNTSEIAAATGSFFDAVMSGTLRHKAEPVLTAAVRDAVRRPLGERWTWKRQGADVTPLVACTIALYGAMNPPEPEIEPWFVSEDGNIFDRV